MDIVLRGWSKCGTNKLCLQKDGCVLDQKETQQYGKYALAIWCFYQPHGRVLVNDNREYERELVRQKKKHQSSSWPLSEVISNGCFVEALALVEELSNVVAGILQQVILNEELDPLGQTQGPRLHAANENTWDKSHFWRMTTVTSTYLFGVHVEFFSAHGHLFIPLHIFPGTSEGRLLVSLDVIT